MATNLPSCFSIQFLEQLLKFLVNFTLLKYVKFQRSYGFLITKELIFGFDLKDHFSAALNNCLKGELVSLNQFEKPVSVESVNRLTPLINPIIILKFAFVQLETSIVAFL